LFKKSTFDDEAIAGSNAHRILNSAGTKRMLPKLVFLRNPSGAHVGLAYAPLLIP